LDIIIIGIIKYKISNKRHTTVLVVATRYLIKNIYLIYLYELFAINDYNNNNTQLKSKLLTKIRTREDASPACIVSVLQMKTKQKLFCKGKNREDYVAIGLSITIKRNFHHTTRRTLAV